MYKYHQKKFVLPIMGKIRGERMGMKKEGESINMMIYNRSGAIFHVWI
jgi:hypothetical protein